MMMKIVRVIKKVKIIKKEDFSNLFLDAPIKSKGNSSITLIIF